MQGNGRDEDVRKDFAGDLTTQKGSERLSSEEVSQPLVEVELVLGTPLAPHGHMWSWAV